MRWVPRIKWHMLRQQKTDPAFDRGNLRAALAAGAVCEVDLRLTADGHAVCLHDSTLDRETSGTGKVLATLRSALAGLRQRGPDGALLDTPPLFLDELTAFVRAAPTLASASIQLDLKLRAQHLDDRIVARLADTLAGVSDAFIASAADWVAVTQLRDAIPGLHCGFDPLALYPRELGLDAAGYTALAARTFALAADARIYYLEARLLVAAAAAGVDLVAMVHARGADVDAWTVDLDRPDLLATLAVLRELRVDQITSNDAAGLAMHAALRD